MSRRSSRRITHGGSRLRRSDALITVCGMAAKTERQAYRGVEMPFDPFSRPLQWDDARRGALSSPRRNAAAARSQTFCRLDVEASRRLARFQAKATRQPNNG